MASMPTPASTKTPSPKKFKLSRLYKPDSLSLEDWQRELRRQFGRAQQFQIANQGEHPVFSEFQVANPQSKNAYRVLIRGKNPGDNFCTCGDFATNTLGTCKHIEFTLGRLENKRGGKKALDDGFQPPYSEVILHYGSRREVKFRPGSDCPVSLARLVGKFFGPDGSLFPDAFARFDSFLAHANQIDHELRCREDVLQFVAEMRDAERRQKIIDEAFPRGRRSAALKKLVKTTLYDYQAEGALFAARAGRCLLGDEMGLGKTIQAITAAEIMARHFGVERVLVVCPTSLKHQWQREIERFTERSVQVIGGMRPQRGLQFGQDSFFKVLNYDTVHADLDLIDAWSPDLVILDEAQRIKNWNTRVARSVKKIQSPYAIVLTGTPLENRLEELVSIVQFVDRFRLGPTYKLLDTHQIRDDHGKVVGYQQLDRLGATLQPILLRRQKNQVLNQLPARLDKTFFVPMTPLQQQLHTENKEIVAKLVSKWKRYKFLSEGDQRRLMIALQNMRMACDNSYLLDQATKEGTKPDELATVLDELFENGESKAVVFSQWLRMHEVLLPALRERGWDFVLFHCGVPGPKRKELVDRFREDPKCRLFLATDAGGVGLNLQFASVVINMDLPWNPAVLEQRIGRVHRLGQKRPVHVVNFVAKGTIEEGMLSVLSFKKSLFAGVLDGGAKEVFLGGSRLTKFMETVEKTTDAIPATTFEDDGQPQREEREQRPTRRDEQRGEERSPAPNDPFAGLLQTGMTFLHNLQGAMQPGAPTKDSFVGRDEKTGAAYLKLPMPKPEMIPQVMQAFATLLQAFAK
jgi:superfamily II DNA or RNA helicase